MQNKLHSMTIMDSCRIKLKSTSLVITCLPFWKLKNIINKLWKFSGGRKVRDSRDSAYSMLFKLVRYSGETEDEVWQQYDNHVS